jgi:cytochrome c peroxidase
VGRFLELLSFAALIALLVPMHAGVVSARLGEAIVVAAIQGAVVDMDPARSAQTPSTETKDWLGRSVELAASRGAKFVVLPERAMTGSLHNGSYALRVAESIPGPTTERYALEAKRWGVWIIGSVVERAEQSNAHHITLVLVDPLGRIQVRQRKMMLRPGGEDGAAAMAGDAWNAVDSIDVGGHRIGLVSGDDLRVGVRRLASRGANTIFVSAAWSGDEQVDWSSRSAALAREFRVDLVVANVAEEHGGIYQKSGRFIPTGAAGVSFGSFAFEGRLLRAPLGLPSVPIPTDYDFSHELASLGRDLFYDVSLSSGRDVSCANCHIATLGFSNGAKHGTGANGASSGRNVPALLNVAYRSLLLWDGASASLELQSKFPMSHIREMNSHYPDLLKRVQHRSDYARRFASLTGRDNLEFLDVARALASYQRTLLSGNSAFDRFRYAGDASALSEAGRRGLDLFEGKARCAQCHSIGEQSSLFSDDRFHATGIGWDRDGFSDLGLGGHRGAGHAGKFRTPSLRNVALTAPYMHDGSLPTLASVIRSYNEGRPASPNLDPLIGPLDLSASEQRDLEVFLRALTGDHEFTPTGQQKFVTEHGANASVASIHFEAVPGALESNRQRLASLVQEASDHGAQIVVLPEYATTGRLRDFRKSAAFSSAELIQAGVARVFQRWAATLGTWIVAPIIESTEATATGGEAGHYITTVLIDDRGRIRAKHRKVHVHPHARDADALPGNWRHTRRVNSPAGQIAVLSGDDVLKGIGHLAQQGAETIFVAASWEPSDGLNWANALQQRSERFGVRIITAALAAPSERDDTKMNIPPRGRIEYERISPERVARLHVPLGLPAVPALRDASLECAELGRQMFFDPATGIDGKTSCASCHDPGAAFIDDTVLATGAFDRVGQRNTQSLLNVAFRPILFWDGRAGSLENQVTFALHGWAEMASTSDRFVEYVASSPELGPAFRQRFGSTSIEEVEMADLAACIADYERTLLSGNSPFDRFYFGGDEDAISRSARRGLEVFLTKGGCADCHSLDPSEAMFSDIEFHNTGVGFHARFLYLGYGGDGLATSFAGRDQFLGEYLTPSLRNIALTAPYMHDGSLQTLADVVDHYNQGGAVNSPFQDSHVRPLGLTSIEREQLIAFLETLTGDHEFDSQGLAITKTAAQ